VKHRNATHHTNCFFENFYVWIIIRPVEVSSKIPVGRFRAVVPERRVKGRDPRFDEFTGELNVGRVEKAYQFIDDMEKQEAENLKKSLKKVKSATKKEEIQDRLWKLVTRRADLQNVFLK
jgi:ribosomal RNA-processing protein 36